MSPRRQRRVECVLRVLCVECVSVPVLRGGGDGHGAPNTAAAAAVLLPVCVLVCMCAAVWVFGGSFHFFRGTSLCGRGTETLPLHRRHPLRRHMHAQGCSRFLMFCLVACVHARALLWSPSPFWGGGGVRGAKGNLLHGISLLTHRCVPPSVFSCFFFVAFSPVSVFGRRQSLPWSLTAASCLALIPGPPPVRRLSLPAAGVSAGSSVTCSGSRVVCVLALSVFLSLSRLGQARMWPTASVTS